MDDLSRFCCLNSECPDHGVRGGGNLSVCDHYGKATPIRFLRCRSCGDRFSERKGTPLFRSHLPSEKATALAGRPEEIHVERRAGASVGEAAALAVEVVFPLGQAGNEPGLGDIRGVAEGPLRGDGLQVAAQPGPDNLADPVLAAAVADQAEQRPGRPRRGEAPDLREGMYGGGQVAGRLPERLPDRWPEVVGRAHPASPLVLERLLGPARDCEGSQSPARVPERGRRRPIPR
jgi:hypothetical protein